MPTKVAPSWSTVERLLDEVEEYTRAVLDLRGKLKRRKLGTAAYHDLLPTLAVQLDILAVKVKHAGQALEEYEESLSDEE